MFSELENTINEVTFGSETYDVKVVEYLDAILIRFN